MRNVNRHEFLVSQWLQPSRVSAMYSAEIVPRKSLLNRFWWVLAGSGAAFLGWQLCPMETLIELMKSF